MWRVCLIALVLIAVARTASAAITVSVTAPSPASGTVSVTVSTNLPKELKELRIIVDGGLAKSCPAPALQCTLSWDTTLVSNGPHAVRGDRVTVRDRILSSAPFTVRVLNTTPPPPATAPPAPPRRLVAAGSGLLVQPTNLAYLGAFRVPDFVGISTFAYGGTSLGYNAANNSLFIVGNDQQQKVAEIGIPAIGTGPLWSLSVAPVLQTFADATDGQLARLAPGATVKIGGLLPYNSQLIVSGYVYYDALGTQAVSHLISGLNLSVRNDARGFFKVGTATGHVSGYMALVPPEWQAALGGPALTGNCCIPIISRTSFGPSVSVFDPGKVAPKPAAPATPLVDYPATQPLAAWDATSPLFNATSEIRGVVLPVGTRSVLFFGRHGTGPFGYGCGTSQQPLPDPTVACNVWVFDPEDSAKGTHAYPYEYRVWAYDVVDLVAVKSGLKQPWQVLPYAIWPLTFPYAPGWNSTHLGGAAYDPLTQRIYVSQLMTDVVGCCDPLPVIHVYEVVGP